MTQSYRNYSRVVKQYLYGDKMAEEVMIMELRSIFRIPYTCETPVELIKYGPVSFDSLRDLGEEDGRSAR